ncbi:hypothetical protein [uncultured Sneathiella sp.]|uniref:hypothetical protein n=1 Tax=uncultured Sneathiella sp. TaxID=879315 RepID=UPI0030DAB26D|tara:strand:+ start:2523 stop:3833 length:1311 start_codon:yes stop_codon:yes gene_type:complete
MSQPIVHVTGKLPDSRVIEFLEAIEENIGGHVQQCLYGNTNVDIEELKEIISETDDTYAITIASFVIGDDNNLLVEYKRNQSGTHPNNGRMNPDIRIPSPYFDEILVTATRPSLDDITRLEVIIQNFAEFHFSDSDVQSSKGAAAAIQKEISSLAKLHRQMISTAEKQRHKYEEEYQERLNALEDKKHSKLDEIQKVADEEKEKLAVLEKEIEEKQKSLDDRDHMHVRRELREKITSNIESNLSTALVPTRSSIMSTFIITISILAAVAFGLLAYENLLALTELIAQAKNKTTDADLNYNLLVWLYSIRAAFVSIASLGFIIYALNWLKRSYLEDVKVSRELQRYALDINRASWTIETVMEMTNDENDNVTPPDHWIESVCYGLFRSGSSEKSQMTALDAWGKLLGVSGKAELGPEGPKLQFNKSDTNKIAKDQSS